MGMDSRRMALLRPPSVKSWSVPEIDSRIDFQSTMRFFRKPLVVFVLFICNENDKDIKPIKRYGEKPSCLAGTCQNGQVANCEETTWFS
jgi:hypothetical protein